MTEHFIQGSGFYQRKVWLLDAAGSDPSHCGIFLDGEFYVTRMGASSLIHELQAKHGLPAMPCVFVSQVDAEARHHDLTCKADFAAFIAQDVMGWLRDRVPTLGEGGHLVAGPSLGGLASAFITLTHPQVFARCLSQSGSFWWEDERLTGMLDELPASSSKFWISVGDQETQAGLTHPPTGLRQDIPQIEGCARFAALLKRHGHEVHYSMHSGSHDTQAWAEELPQALPWLLRGS